jgi:nucleoid DNA-binding protein
MGRTTVRTVVAGSVAGLGLAVGGIAISTAGDETSPSPSPSQGAGELERGFVHRGGPFGDEFAERLAEALGVEEAEVEAALEDVRDELAPGRPDFDRDELPDPPTEEEREARQAELAAALAEALGIDQSRVEEALEELRAELETEMEERFGDMRAEMRSGLVERLDEAVADGTLTESDKESVLKAYDEGVIGFPPGLVGEPGHGMFGWGPGGPFGGSDGSDQEPDTQS